MLLFGVRGSHALTTRSFLKFYIAIIVLAKPTITARELRVEIMNTFVAMFECSASRFLGGNEQLLTDVYLLQRAEKALRGELGAAAGGGVRHHL